MTKIEITKRAGEDFLHYMILVDGGDIQSFHAELIEKHYILSETELNLDFYVKFKTNPHYKNIGIAHTREEANKRLYQRADEITKRFQKYYRETLCQEENILYHFYKK